MNAIFTIQEKTWEPALPDMADATQTVDIPATRRPQESSRISSAELAQKVLRLTGSVRLVSRSAHHWHHCGINE